ncbi:MAG TPA: hypothetical protein VI386_08230 [Candidatus Sulfotelmatobacter sp.]
MTAAPKQPSQAPARHATATTEIATTQTQRKPWKKKTPAEIMLGQIDRLREDVAEKEEELKKAKRQLQKFEEARKILEST